MNVSDIADLVIPEVPSAFMPTVKDMVVRAARTFCDETYAVRENVVVYVPDNSLLGEVESDENYDVISVCSLDAGRQWKQITPTTIQFGSANKAAERMRAVIAVRPPLKADVLPESMNSFVDAIVAGATMYLLLMPYSWGDSNRAAYFQSQFYQYIHNAKQAAANGFESRPRRLMGGSFL